MSDEIKRNLEKIGQILKLRRKELKLSQEVLADNIGIERKHLSAIENGKQNMTISTLYKVTKALDISIFEVFKRADE